MLKNQDCPVCMHLSGKAIDVPTGEQPLQATRLELRLRIAPSPISGCYAAQTFGDALSALLKALRHDDCGEERDDHACDQDHNGDADNETDQRYRENSRQQVSSDDQTKRDQKASLVCTEARLIHFSLSFPSVR